MRSVGLVMVLAGIFVEDSPAQIADYGPAQLARQAADIRAPYLARMAQIQYGTASPQSGKSRSPASTTFKRARSWFKPWSMANEISKNVEWDPNAPFGTGFAREEAQRQALTKLFTACLDTYEEQTKAAGLPTDDLAITYGHTIALNWELANGKRMETSDEAALRDKLRDQFAQSPLYWTDADKQSVHETLVITTMLAVAGYANAAGAHDDGMLAEFREAGRKNVEALTNATLLDLRNARSALGGK